MHTILQPTRKPEKTMGSWEYDFPWKCVGMTILGHPLGFRRAMEGIHFQLQTLLHTYSELPKLMLFVTGTPTWPTMVLLGTASLQLCDATVVLQAIGCNKYSKVHGYYTWTSVGSNGNQSKSLCGKQEQRSSGLLRDTSVRLCDTCNESELHHR